MLTEKQETTLRAAVDRIIPPDDLCAGGAEAGALGYILLQLTDGGNLNNFASDYRAGLDALEDFAQNERGIAFVDLAPDAQDVVLTAFEQATPRFFRLLVEHAQEGFLYVADSLGNDRLGGTRLMAAPKYEVIVVGAGAGGGVLAGVLAHAGKRVLLLERGPALRFADVGRDHLRNQRLSQYGNNAGPDGPNEPRALVTQGGTERAVLPHEGGYNNNAATVGGGTLVYGAQAWRFHPLDFKMASTYGIPPGSSLADWPVGYEDLAPFYERAEHELGVAGTASAMTHLPPYRTDYPMPPQEPLSVQGQTLRAGAANLGWHTLPIPLAINTVPRAGRPACIRCQHCVGFACPVDAKNGTQNTLIPRAILTGKCDLLTGAMAQCVETDNAGKAWGVTYRAPSGEIVTERAEVIALCGGAVETARLLLLSGLGNDHVGRHLQGHTYPGVMGRFAHPVWDGLGPGVTTAVTKFNHGNGGDIIGGGMLADEFIPLPITFWKRMTPPDLPRWGRAPKHWMRDHFRFTTDIKGPVQDIPSPDGRVTLSETVRDTWGQPVARFSGAIHPETARTAQFMWHRAKEWIEASGAVETWGSPPKSVGLSGGQHQAGTCRMGDDPEASVTDRFCRVHGHDNLYVGDGSVHVTNGGFNPFLTIMALAYRTADHIVKNW